MNIRILVDWKYEGKIFIEDELAKRKIMYKIYDIKDYSMKDRINKYRIVLLYFKYLKQAYEVISSSLDSDLIICLNYTTSIAAGFFAKIKGRKCTVLGLNIIAPYRHWLIEKIRFLLYHNVMNWENFYITVNSKDYINDYSKRFKVNENKFFVLHDAVVNTNDSSPFLYRRSYVFCGGEAKRDWDTMLKACKDLPEIKFVFIARKKYFDNNLIVPPNATLLFDLSEEEFYQYLIESALVAMPLETSLPAGLIVILKSALHHKPLIVTRTPSTENYITDNHDGYLVELKDSKDLTEKIHKLYNDPGIQDMFTRNLYEKVIKYHSPENRALSLISIINKIVTKEYNQ